MHFAKFLPVLMLCAGPLIMVGDDAHGQLLPGTAESEQDWLDRSGSTGVFYKNNFGAYASSDELRNAAQSLTHIPGEKEVLLENTVVISGGSSLRIRTDSSAGKNGGAWGDLYKNGETVKDFYFQASLYLPKETIGWISKGSDGQLKLVNMEQYGSGQIVIHHNKGLGFPTLMTNGAGVIQRYLPTTPYAGGGDWFYQNAIDSGSSISDGQVSSYWRRFGPSRQTRARFDYSYNASNSAQNFVYNRGFSWPDADALASGAVPWNTDGWTTIEVQVSVPLTGKKTVKMWAAAYGEAPTLVVDIDAPDTDLSQVPGVVSDYYKQFELLNYETPREAEPGYRPVLNTYYDEIIASTNPIPFPGGHALDGSSGPGSDPSGGSGGTDLSTVNAPAWVKDIAPGTWQAISRNTLADVDPADDPAVNPNYPGSPPWSGTTGQEAVTKSWNGGALADGYGNRGGLIMYGGGHANYYGSEVYAFDLETREWTRLSDPYAGPFNWPYPQGEYPDGSAIPPHTFDFVDYHPGSNSFVLLKGQDELGPPSNSTQVDIPHMFDLDTLTWRRGAENTDRPRLYSGGYSIYDSARDIFWVHGGASSDNFAAFDPKGQNPDGTYGSWQTYPQQLAKTNSVAAHHPHHDLMLVTVFRDDDRIAAIDLKEPGSRYEWLNEAGSAPTKRPSHGWSWSRARGAILHFGRSGDAVHEFRSPGDNWRTDPWQWNNLTSSGNSVVPQTALDDNGVFSRFRVVSYADEEVAIVVNRTDGPVYAFRVPPAVRPKKNEEFRVIE